MVSRQNFNLFYYLLHGKIKEFFKRKMWKNEYFWQDTFLTFFNRLIGCKIFGHRKIHFVEDENDKPVVYCFNCYRKIANSTLERKVKRCLKIR
jgi:hypothetical protein